MSRIRGCGVDPFARFFNIMLMALAAGLVTAMVASSMGAAHRAAGGEWYGARTHSAFTWIWAWGPSRCTCCRWRSLSAGLACGAAMLGKPIAILLPVAG
ncbi:MAG: hypothetical protein QME74_09250 [Candidatus Edwardsbacteria bacterium]|nr:hypothetical protein [Candidatus Edwardsbacteria bacterium]